VLGDKNSDRIDLDIYDLRLRWQFGHHRFCDFTTKHERFSITYNRTNDLFVSRS
jgi:hypothetical protein